MHEVYAHQVVELRCDVVGDVDQRRASVDSGGQVDGNAHPSVGCQEVKFEGPICLSHER